MSDAPGRFIQANGLRHHYLEYGRGGRELVICHKVTAGAETWEELAGRLADRYRVIVPDLRGHGYTDKPDGGYSLVDYGRDLAALIAELGLSRPVVVGHSLGGRIALQLAAYHPDSVRRVVAVDPPVSGPGRRRYPYSLESFHAWRADVEARGVRAVASSASAYTPRQAELRARYGVMHSVNAMVESWFGFHLEDLSERVRRLAVPAMLMYAERGVVLDEEAHELAALNPELRRVRVPDAGHNLPWDNWPAFAEALDGFLADAWD